MNDGLKDKHRQAIIRILASNPKVERVVLFGSRAMGTHTPASDVDIALFGDALTLDDQARLSAKGDDLPVPQRIDLLCHNAIKNRKLLDHIKKHGVEWYRREDRNSRPSRTAKANSAKHDRKDAGRSAMASDGRMMPLGEVAHIVMGLSPKGDTYNHDGRGEPLLNGPTEFGPTHPIPVLFTTSPSRFAEPGDILFCVRGSTTGRMNWADRRYAIGRGIAAIRAKTNNSDTYFIYCSILADLPRLLSLTSGSVFPSLSTGDFAAFEIPWPDSSARDGAVRALRSLDDKIDLNRRMNRTLEKMAAAIFKSWFIDFDPVHANAEGRDTNLPAEIADLFPNRLEDSDLGPIPKGWDVKTLGEAVTLTGGGTPKKSIDEYWGGSIPWFSVVDAPSPSDVFVIDTRDHITEAGLAGSSTRLLPLGTTIISARGTVGKCALVGTPMAMNQSCYGVRGRHPDTDIFTYYLLQQHVGTLSRSGHGSVFNTITRATFDSIHIIATPPTLASAFDDNVAPLMNRILANNKASQTLAGLRDTLLPKLLSGEIELPDVEAVVEEVL